VTYVQAQALVDEGHQVTVLFQVFDDSAGKICCRNPGFRYGSVAGAKDAGECFDVIVATWWETVFELPQLHASTYLYFVQSDERRYYPGEQNELERTLVELTYRMPSLGIITEARWLQALLEKEFAATTRYAPNGIDTRLFNPQVVPLVPRGDRIRILVEGPGAKAFKRVGDAFSALNALRSRYRFETWYVSSDGVTLPAWRPDAIYVGVSPWEMPRIYRSCDILVKLSAVEGFFGPPLEMMACGGTCVVSDVSGHEEYVVDGDNALVVPIGDIEAATRAIERLLCDPELRIALSANGIRTATTLDWRQRTPLFSLAVRELHGLKTGLSPF